MASGGLDLLFRDTVKICQELIQIPSVNYGEGKGDEIAISEYVANFLKVQGLEPEIIKTGESRANVVAKISGKNPTLPGLVLHGHIDVVPANAADWSVDPFAGEIRDGAIWGRGAVDMKNVDAMILAIVAAWRRENYQPERNILLVFFDGMAFYKIFFFKKCMKETKKIYLEIRFCNLFTFTEALSYQVR